MRICKGHLPSQPSPAVLRKVFTRRIKRWHSKALMDFWFVTTRKIRIVRSGEVSGCSCSMAVPSAKGLRASAIRPSGSKESSNSGRGEPALISCRNRWRRSRIFSGCKSEIAWSNALGSRFRSSGTAIVCKSRTPSGVAMGEPASTRSAHSCRRKRSANIGANSSSLSMSWGSHTSANVSSRVCSKS